MTRMSRNWFESPILSDFELTWDPKIKVSMKKRGSELEHEEMYPKRMPLFRIHWEFQSACPRITTFYGMLICDQSKDITTSVHIFSSWWETFWSRLCPNEKLTQLNKQFSLLFPPLLMGLITPMILPHQKNPNPGVLMLVDTLESIKGHLQECPDITLQIMCTNHLLLCVWSEVCKFRWVQLLPVRIKWPSLKGKYWLMII
jgi:hypothetical protein